EVRDISVGDPLENVIVKSEGVPVESAVVPGLKGRMFVSEGRARNGGLGSYSVRAKPEAAEAEADRTRVRDLAGGLIDVLGIPETEHAQTSGSGPTRGGRRELRWKGTSLEF